MQHTCMYIFSKNYTYILVSLVVFISGFHLSGDERLVPKFKGGDGSLWGLQLYTLMTTLYHVQAKWYRVCIVLANMQL